MDLALKPRIRESQDMFPVSQHPRCYNVFPPNHLTLLSGSPKGDRQKDWGPQNLFPHLDQSVLSLCSLHTHHRGVTSGGSQQLFLVLHIGVTLLVTMREYMGIYVVSGTIVLKANSISPVLYYHFGSSLLTSLVSFIFLFCFGVTPYHAQGLL